ncbi:hypothetical protein HWV23_06530 [Natronomonas halophila]|uniref:NUDIX hydrolase n=1 Tax=Natronomonas halophila TaxID=2747817 RepID=UPI0015B78D29|nr:hypothetical protein [Natronomonas halophila]QLD85397.1 hypothetical protein HWV23_06530 [Natronomonas halophila]
MKSLHDPEQLRDRADVSFHEETHVVDREEFDATRENVDSHIVVGVTNDSGEVLLVNDGSHGWTLAAFPLESAEDAAVTARQALENLTGISISLDCPERVRHIEFRSDGDDARQFSMYNVILRASPVDGRPVASEPTLGHTEVQDIGWFAEVPEGTSDELGDDIRLFLE